MTPIRRITRRCPNATENLKRNWLPPAPLGSGVWVCSSGPWQALKRWELQPDRCRPSADHEPARTVRRQVPASSTACACEPNGHVVIVLAEDHCSSARPACGHSRHRNDNGYEQEGRYFTTQQEPEGAEEVGVEVRLPVSHEERDGRSQACTTQGNGERPVCGEVPGCYGESPLRRRSTHSDPLALRRLAVAVHDAGPLRIPLAVSGRPAEPDGLALDP